MVRAFLSHISEDKLVAQRIKTALSRDFFGLLDIFLSSDTQRIAAGEKWLESIEQALQESTFSVVLCSRNQSTGRGSILKPVRHGCAKIPLIPICHALRPRDLPIPLSLRQGIAIGNPDGLERLYNRVAITLSCQVPAVKFAAIAHELSGSAPAVPQGRPALQQLEADRAIRQRLEQSLNHPKYGWHFLEFGKCGARIVGFLSRVGEHR